MARYGMEYGGRNRNRARGFAGRGYAARSPEVYGADYDTGRGGTFYGANFGNFGYTGRGNVGTDFYGGGYDRGFRPGATFGRGRGTEYGRTRGLDYGTFRERVPGGRGRGGGRGYDVTSYGPGYGSRFETTTAEGIARRNFYDREF